MEKSSFLFKRIAYFLIITGILLLSYQTQAFANVDDPNAILLKSRTFVPTTLVGQLSTLSHNEQYSIIQFNVEPDTSILSALASLDVAVIEYVPKNAVMVHIPANTDLSGIAAIRWVGGLTSQDKVSTYLAGSLQKGYILVDVSSFLVGLDAKNLITSTGGIVVENAYPQLNTYLVQADENIAAALSQTDAVNWICAASDALIEGLPVHSCPGPMNSIGPVGNYVTQGNGWDDPGLGSASLSYHFENGTPDLPGTTEEAEIEKGLFEWSKYVDIS